MRRGRRRTDSVRGCAGRPHGRPRDTEGAVESAGAKRDMRNVIVPGASRRMSPARTAARKFAKPAPQSAPKKSAKPAAKSAKPGALPEWNLADLYPAIDSPELKRDLDRADADSIAFEE